MAKAWDDVRWYVNDISGYIEVDKLAKKVKDADEMFTKSWEKSKIAKRNYAKHISQYAQTQQQINLLLQRKDDWVGGDLEKFTSLCENEHKLKQHQNTIREYTENVESTVE